MATSAKAWSLAVLLSVGLGLAALPARADKTAGGVQFKDTVEVSGQTLTLNGAGVRTRLMVKVYAIGLYLPSPARDTAAVLAQGGPKQIRMQMKRDLSKETIGDAIREGFERNAGAKLPSLKARLDTFIGALPDLKEGDVITLTLLPDRGTQVRTPQGELGIPGRDFADALLGVWLGAKPADADVKQALLQGR